MEKRERNNRAEGIVYSTEQGGEMCPGCRSPRRVCSCAKKSVSASAAPPRDGIVRVGRETKGRKGKGVTLITGVPLSPSEANQLCTRLKKRCGSGGTLNDSGVIEIQGDHRDTIIQELTALGWTVKRAGA